MSKLGIVGHSHFRKEVDDGLAGPTREEVGSEFWDPPCRVCKVVDDEPNVLCELCNDAYHLKCIEKINKPPLPRAPTDDEWFCRSCVKRGVPELILDRVGRDSAAHYLVKWLGKPNWDVSWEHAKIMDTAWSRMLIRQYLEKVEPARRDIAPLFPPCHPLVDLRGAHMAVATAAAAAAAANPASPYSSAPTPAELAAGVELLRTLRALCLRVPEAHPFGELAAATAKLARMHRHPRCASLASWSTSAEEARGGAAAAIERAAAALKPLVTLATSAGKRSTAKRLAIMETASAAAAAASASADAGGGDPAPSRGRGAKGAGAVPASADGLPPGWTEEERQTATKRKYSVFHGPGSARALSKAEVWRKVGGVSAAATAAAVADLPWLGRSAGSASATKAAGKESAVSGGAGSAVGGKAASKVAGKVAGKKRAAAAAEAAAETAEEARQAVRLRLSGADAVMAESSVAGPTAAAAVAAAATVAAAAAPAVIGEGGELSDEVLVAQLRELAGRRPAPAHVLGAVAVGLGHVFALLEHPEWAKAAALSRAAQAVSALRTTLVSLIGSPPVAAASDATLTQAAADCTANSYRSFLVFLREQRTAPAPAPAASTTATIGTKPPPLPSSSSSTLIVTASDASSSSTPAMAPSAEPAAAPASSLFSLKEATAAAGDLVALATRDAAHLGALGQRALDAYRGGLRALPNDLSGLERRGGAIGGAEASGQARTAPCRVCNEADKRDCLTCSRCRGRTHLMCCFPPVVAAEEGAEDEWTCQECRASVPPPLSMPKEGDEVEVEVLPTTA